MLCNELKKRKPNITTKRHKCETGYIKEESKTYTLPYVVHYSYLDTANHRTYDISMGCSCIRIHSCSRERKKIHERGRAMS